MPDQSMTSTPVPGAALAGTPGKERFLGVDVARGVALISMFAANIWDDLGKDGEPTIAVMTVIGRSATMFVMVAGISLAFISGGRRPVQGLARRAARANIAVRAVLIGAIGLALGYVASASLPVILTYYGLFFLLAIPLVGLRPRTLVGIAGALVVVGPLLLLASYYRDREAAFQTNPTLSAPFTDPVGFVSDLLVTGEFPAVVYMAYLCAGIAIGRLDLSSTTVAVRLLVGGLALAVVSWFSASVVLFPLGGLAVLLEEADPGLTVNQVLWSGYEVDEWWWLATRSHHSGTPIDMLHTLGSAIAVLGAVLLVTRIRVAQRLLRPVALAGAMTLTVYSAHVVILATPLLRDDYLALWLVILAGALLFAVLWNRWVGQGPLERLVAIPADRARAAVLAGRLSPRRGRHRRGRATPRPAVPSPRGAHPAGDRSSADQQDPHGPGPGP